MALNLRSTAFAHNTTMPAEYTCEGRNISPPLSWSAPPAGAKSLVLIVDDPDAPDPAHPRTIWVHWLLYNLHGPARGRQDAAGRDARRH